MSSGLNLEIVRASGSTIDRVARCNASAALPQVIDDNERNFFAGKGSAMHEFLNRVPEVGYEAALLEVDENHREFCESIQLAKLKHAQSMSREFAIAYNWRDDTARLLKRNELGRVEVDRSCEIATIVDFGGVSTDAVATGDYKSGYQWLPPPEESFQLGTGLVALARLYDKRKGIAEYIRVLDDGSTRRKFAEFDGMALDMMAMKIADTMRNANDLRLRVMGGYVPDVREGPWCKYCPAKYGCPAKTSMIRAIVDDPAPIRYVLPMTAESAASAFLQIRKAKEIIKMAEGAVYKFALLAPFLIETEEDGTEHWLGEFTRPAAEEFKGEVAHAEVSKLYGGEIANSVVSMETTKAALTNAVKAEVTKANQAAKDAGLKPELTIKGETEKLYKAIRDAGGKVEKTTSTTTEYTKNPKDGTLKQYKRKAGS